MSLNRTIALVAVAGGGVLIAAGWFGDDGNWESVAINIGTALSLVVVLIFIEDKWRAGADQRIEQVRRDVRDVRSFAEDIAQAQVRQQAGRIGQDRALINAWKKSPGPAELWAVAQRCEALGLLMPVTVVVASAAINFLPTESGIQLTVNPQPASAGTPSSEQFLWKPTHTRDEVLEWLNEAMVRLKIHPGEIFRIDEVVETVGDEYLTRISGGFNGTS